MWRKKDEIEKKKYDKKKDDIYKKNKDDTEEDEIEDGEERKLEQDEEAIEKRKIIWEIKMRQRRRQMIRKKVIYVKKK